jgi:hypothetical protein
MADSFIAPLDLILMDTDTHDNEWGIKLNENFSKINLDAADTDTHLTALDTRCATIEGNVTTLFNADAALSARISSLETRMGNIETRMAAAENVAWRSSFYGEIRMWAGALADIPNLGGAGSNSWRLCDGTNATPDLRDKFVLGAHSGRAPWQAGGSFNSGNVVTDQQGWHNHANQWHVLTEAQMPSHQHGGTTNEVGDHAHYAGNFIVGGNVAIGGGSDYNHEAHDTNPAGRHSHVFATDFHGGNEGHTHGMDGAGTHGHNLSVPIVPPYMALCYIMRMF